MRLFAGLVLPVLVTLSGCVSSPASAPEGGQSDDTRPPVAATRAFTLFDDVCGGSLPDFATAEARMAKIGVTAKNDTGTIHSPDEVLSFSILDGPGAGTTSCSMVWGSVEPDKDVVKAMTEFTTFARTSLGVTGRYKGRTLILFDDVPRQYNGVQYFNIRMLSER